MNPEVPPPLAEMAPKGAAVHSGDVVTKPEMMPAVGSTSEHCSIDGDEARDQSKRSDWLKSAVTQLPPLQTSVAANGATARDEGGKLGDDVEFPEGKPWWERSAA